MVTPFATAAARTSAITVPVEGMLSYLVDSDSLWVYQGAAWVPAADHSFADSTARTTAIPIPVDGMLSTLTTTDRVDVYNGASWSALVAPSNGALTTWTPVVTQGATPTTTVTSAVMIRVGRMIYFETFLTFGVTPGTAANDVVISLPVTAAARYGTSAIRFGTGTIIDSSASGEYFGPLVSVSTTTVKIKAANSLSSNVFYGSTTFTAALATGDNLIACGSYEAAADG